MQRAELAPVTTQRTAVILLVLMILAAVAAVGLRPKANPPDLVRRLSLESMVPRQFGDWGEQLAGRVLVVNPQTKELLDKLYNQVLTRSYVNAQGYRIMLSIAYGSGNTSSLQAHKPEVCYPAQGFTVQRNETGKIKTEFGVLPVRRLFATMLSRQEPITYWFTMGNEAVLGRTQMKIIELRFGLTGEIPDGLLFRVSSIDSDRARAYRMQDLFINQLLQSVPPADRTALSGLGRGS